jgi:hypothetical protein
LIAGSNSRCHISSCSRSSRRTSRPTTNHVWNTNKSCTLVTLDLCDG